MSPVATQLRPAHEIPNSPPLVPDGSEGNTLFVQLCAWLVVSYEKGVIVDMIAPLEVTDTYIVNPSVVQLLGVVHEMSIGIGTAAAVPVGGLYEPEAIREDDQDAPALEVVME